MTAERERVANLIRDAFKGVTLGNGVGLWEGQALDDYADAKTRAEARARDEKADWSLISIDDLNRCNSSLSFFDAEGMRFHLPAFLLAELEGPLWAGPMYHLTSLDDYGKSKFAALSGAQRRAVREFLLFFLNDPSCMFRQPEVESALKEFWTEEQTQPTVSPNGGPAKSLDNTGATEDPPSVG